MKSSEKFVWIYRNYRISMLAVAYSIVKNKEMAEDLVHVAFVNIMEKIDILKIDDAKTKAYCIITVKNISLNYRKREKLYKMEPIQHYEEKIVDINSIDGIDQIEQKLAYEGIVKEINTLPDIQRKVFWLKNNYGFSFSIIGEMLGISPTNARKIHSRAKKKLKTMIEGKDYWYE